MEYRIEHDSMGEVKVPADKYWGAQTQRSCENFPIGVGLETMPREMTHAFGILKKASAMVSHVLRPEKMTEDKLSAICTACDEVISGSLNEHFPLVVWQTGSGTQSNMNASMLSFHDHCVAGIRANRDKMHHNLHDSLMLVTALNPYIGYENAAKTAKKAYADGISLKEACVALGYLSEAQFDEVFHPETMI